MTEPVLFKSFRQEKEWESDLLDPLLQNIVTEFANEAFAKYGWLPTITDILRTKSEDRAMEGTGMHVLGRAVDVRVKGVRQEVLDAMVGWSNARWAYDPKRSQFLVAYAKPHGTGPHIHFQVCASTRRKQ